jgi:hypothetical protein
MAELPMSGQLSPVSEQFTNGDTVPGCGVLVGLEGVGY